MQQIKKLTTLYGPYIVEPAKKPQEAIKFALKKNLIEKFGIGKKLIKDYLNSKADIPIWIIEAACVLNKKDAFIPIQYQYLWFCLHGIKVKRTQSSGRKFNSIVNFSPCYITLDNRIRRLILKAQKLLNLSQRKFSVLCGYRSGSVRAYKDKMPLVVILKICRILNINIWKVLENYEFFGKTSREGKIIIPKHKKDIDIDIILTWLRTEGHLEIRSTHVEINQKDDTKTLEKLRELIIKKFDLKETKKDFSKGKRGEDRLIISSSPLRQLLCLKYNLPLGYKSCSLKRMDLNNLSNEDYRKIMAAFVQTEGCLSYFYTRNKKKKLPKFEFSVKDESLAKDCIFVLEKLKFKPILYKQNLFKIGLYNSKDTIRLVHQIEPYVFNKNKIDHLKKMCTNGIGL